MSNISASKFVNIAPKLLVAQGSGFALNGLLLSLNEDLPTDKALIFNSLAEVGDYFGSVSDEYKFAQSYFHAYDAKSKIPASLLISRYSLDPVAGWLRGAAIDVKMQALTTITNGSLTLVIGDNTYALTGIDLSGAVSFSSIAQIIADKMAEVLGAPPEFANAAISYNSHFKAFKIVGGDAFNGSVGYCLPAGDEDLSSILKLDENSGGLISPLRNQPIALSEFMQTLISQSSNWVSFAKLWGYLEPEDLAFASWAGAQNNGTRFIYVHHGTEINDKNPQSSDDFASKIKDNAISATSINYGSFNLAAFVMGVIASINYDTQSGALTLAFKAQSGQPITCDNDSDFEALTGKGFNVYGRDSSANNVFTGYQKGSVSGAYGFTDSLVNHIWLNDSLQVALRNLQNRIAKIPYNDTGLNYIRSSVSEVASKGLFNGVIDKGVELSADLINAVVGETGLPFDDIESALFSQGWLLYAALPSSEVRAERGSPDLKFFYCDGGSIQKINLTSMVIR
jgi:hypothetical protein